MPSIKSKNSFAGFQRAIKSYHRDNRRDLPWRRTHNAYRIVVSEIMLQQTQVARVLIKYPEFIKAFPNFAALARAPLPTLLRVWQGMGYNRRALSLKKIAQAVGKEYRGRLPRDPEALVQLPGIGPATAASIAAFVFNAPTVFIETNIRRVFIHFFFPRSKSVSDKQLLPLIEATLDKKNPREWYFALMDYGAMLAKTGKNANRQSRHYKRQSTFEGSNRQLRGLILRSALVGGSVSARALCASDPGLKSTQVRAALAQLASEGFLVKGGSVGQYAVSAKNRGR